MDEFKARVAAAALGTFTDDALARQLRILMERGTSKEWRQAALEEAAKRLEGSKQESPN